MLKAIADVEKIETMPFEVSEVMVPLLEELRGKLDKVNPEHPGQQRFEAARDLGCGSAVSKGAKYRSLLPERIFIPSTETRRANGGIRISALKTTIPDVPADVAVKAVLFIREEGAWAGRLEVKKLAA